MRVQEPVCLAAGKQHTLRSSIPFTPYEHKLAVPDFTGSHGHIDCQLSLPLLFIPIS